MYAAERVAVIKWSDLLATCLLKLQSASDCSECHQQISVDSCIPTQMFKTLTQQSKPTN